MRTNYFLFAIIAIIYLSSCSNSKENESKINLRLKWAYQAQFSGYLVAKEKGYYKEAGMDVNIQPAGPDLHPYNTVASGSDDIGIGIVSQLISARSNGVPLVAIAQIFQNSPIRFVLKKENKIDSLQQLKGKKVGLWLGGDEIEFISMLKSKGMSMKDIDVIPQKFSIAPFLNNEYVCSQVMVYNELNQIKGNGYADDKLQIISPKDYNSAILGDLIFTSEKYLKEHPDLLSKFLTASFRGWKYTMDHPDEAIEIVMKFNPELKKEEQKIQLNSIIELIKTESEISKGLGNINSADYANAKRILLGSLDSNSVDYNKVQKIDITSTYTTSVLDKVEPSIKKLN